MSSKSGVVRVPVIDFSEVLKPGTAEWDRVKGQVRQALEEYGCFEAALDQDILELRKPLFGAMEQLFDLPSETKERYVSKKPFRGYFGAGLSPYEYITIDEPTSADNIHQGLTNLFWPQGNPSFSKTVVSLVEVASEFEKRIRRMILESFGLEKYMDEHMDFTSYMLKLSKFPRPAQSSESEPTLGAHAHTDQNMVTLLYQVNEVNGLEVQTKDGQWIQVNPSPTSFIVMIGDSLSVWLNGRLCAPNHRVMLTEDKPRYSVGLFASPKGGYQVKPPQEVVDQQNPLLFKPFDLDEYMKHLQAQVSRGGPISGLKVYCAAASD